MNTIQRIFKNSGVLFIAQIINYGLAFFYTIYTARFLGAEGFGILSFAISFTMILGIAADLGLSVLAIREISRDKSISKQYTGNFLVIKLFLSSFTIVLIALLINILKYPAQTIQVVYLMAFWAVFISFTQFFYSIFQAHEKMEYQALGTIFYSLILLLGTFYGIYNNFTIQGFAIVYLISSFMVLLITLIVYLVKFSWPHLEINWDFWKSQIILALPLIVASVFHTIANKIDTVLLSLIQDNVVVGWYSASYKILEVLLFIPIVYNAAMYPVISKFYISSKESLQQVYIKSIKYLIILGLPIASSITILSNEIILTLFQSGYAQSVLALQILIWTIPFLLLTSTFNIILISMNKQILQIKITFIYMIFNISVNLMLIPFFSYLGAAFVTVVTELVAFIILFHYLSNFICKVPLKKFVWKPALATAIMSIFMLLVDLNIFILVLISAILYLGLLISFKTFSKGDFDLIRKLLER